MNPHVSNEELEKALRLNKHLAWSLFPPLADDLISAGHEAIARALHTFKSGPATFAHFVSFAIKREQRREMINIFTGLTLPANITGYQERWQRLLKVEIDSLVDEDTGNPMPWESIAIRPEQPLDEIAEVLALLSEDDRALVLDVFFEERKEGDIRRERRWGHAKLKKRLADILEQLRGYLGVVPRTITEEERDAAVVRDYLTGFREKALMARYQISKRKYTELTKPHHKPRSYDVAGIVECYRDGWQLAMIKEHFKVSEKVMQSFLSDDDRRERQKHARNPFDI